jgi:hypothetical protein
VSDIDTAAVDSLKALDPERPIREATNAPLQTPTLFDHLGGSRDNPFTVDHSGDPISRMASAKDLKSFRPDSPLRSSDF